MGKEKYQKKIMDLFEKSPVVKHDSINRIIKNPGYTKQLIKNLVSKDKIKKLTKGCYTKKDEISLIVFCIKPSYLGLQDALSAHDLWEQETIPVLITTRKVRAGLRKINGGNVLIRSIDKKYFFGYDYTKPGEFYLPYSNIEKTFIDMIYFRQNISQEALRNLRKRIDRNKLKKYLKKYPKTIKKRISLIIGKKQETP